MNGYKTYEITTRITVFDRDAVRAHALERVGDEFLLEREAEAKVDGNDPCLDWLITILDQGGDETKFGFTTVEVIGGINC